MLFKTRDNWKRHWKLNHPQEECGYPSLVEGHADGYFDRLATKVIECFGERSEVVPKQSKTQLEIVSVT